TSSKRRNGSYATTKSTTQPSDVKPRTAVATLDLSSIEPTSTYSIEKTAAVVGMSEAFIRRVVGNTKRLTVSDVALLLNQDAFCETFVPRSRIFDFLSQLDHSKNGVRLSSPNPYSLIKGNALELILQLPNRSVQCVVTSTPYWAMRLYEDMAPVKW